MLSHKYMPTYAYEFRIAINLTCKPNFSLHVFTTEMPVFDQDYVYSHVTIKQTAVVEVMLISILILKAIDST